MEPYRVVLADNHALMRDCIRKILAQRDDLRVVAEFEDGLGLLQYMCGSEPLPQMVILDITMPGLDGIEITRRIKRTWPNVSVLILTVHKEKPYLDRAFAAGADGYLLKDESDSDLLSAVDTIQRNSFYLSPLLMTART